MINISDGGLLPALLCAGLGWGIAYVTLSARYKEELRDCKKKLSEKLHSMEKRLSAAQEKLSEKENVVVVLQRDITSHKHELARLQKQIDAQVGKTIAIYGKNHSVATAESLPPLCDEQRRILDAVLRGGNFFIQGRAGTGKSTLLAHLRKELEAQGRRVRVACFTAVAAVNVQGCTIHSLFKFPPLDFFPPYELAPRGRARATLRNMDVLIVDEVSMVRPDMLDAMDVHARKARESEEPFGGLQVILMGDLMQLPPVVVAGVKKVFKEWYGRTDDPYDPYFFDAPSFKEGKFCRVLLQTIHRQQDTTLLGHLQNIRASKNVSQAVSYFHSLEIPDAGVRDAAVHLYPKKVSVERYNKAMLDKIAGVMWEYGCQATGKFAKPENDSNDVCYPAPQVLQLKVNALVLVLRNIDFPDCINGSQGIVRELSQDAVTIQMRASGKEYVLPRETWEQQEFDRNGEPEVVGTFTQFPLQLGYAMTIHKAQGKTLPKVWVNLNSAFTTGQAYVALSRTRHAADMHVENITPNSVLVDERVVSWLKGQKWMQL